MMRFIWLGVDRVYSIMLCASWRGFWGNAKLPAGVGFVFVMIGLVKWRKIRTWHSFSDTYSAVLAYTCRLSCSFGYGNSISWIKQIMHTFVHSLYNTNCNCFCFSALYTVCCLHWWALLMWLIFLKAVFMGLLMLC